MDTEEQILQGATLYDGRPADGDASRTDAEVTVYDFLDRTGVSYHTLCHPAAFTMEECEAVRRRIGAPVFKNLFLTNRQQTDLYLLMIPADKPFKTKYLSSQLGCARLSFATADKMEELLHIQPGAVSPMGLIHDTKHKVRLIIDRDLEQTGTYACHPCVNTVSVSMSLSDLLDKVIPATGHSRTTIRDSVLTNSERELYLCRQKESWVITNLCPMSIQRHGRVTRINARQTAISH